MWSLLLIQLHVHVPDQLLPLVQPGRRNQRSRKKESARLPTHEKTEHSEDKHGRSRGHSECPVHRGLQISVRKMRSWIRFVHFCFSLPARNACRTTSTSPAAEPKSSPTI